MGQVERSIAVVDIERPETATRIASVRSASLEIEIDDEDEFSHDGPAVDLDELRRQEINQYPVLDNIYYWKFSAEVFCGQLALRALGEKLDHDVLSDRNRKRVGQLLEKDHCRSLLNEFNLDLKNRIRKTAREKNKPEALNQQYLEMIARYDEWFSSKIEEILQIENPVKREEIFNRLINRQISQADSACRAHHDLINHNLKLSRHWARKKYNTRDEMLSLDIESYARLGLIKAAARFDFRKRKGRRIRFSTYATHWILQSIKRGLQENKYIIHLPVHVQDTLDKLEAIQERMAQKPGPKSIPALEDLIDQVPEKHTITDALKTRRVISLDQSPPAAHFMQDGDDLVFSEVVPEAENVEEEGERDERKEKVQEVLASLTPRERRIIELRFGIGDGVSRTLNEVRDEVHEEFPVTRERIRQIETKALRKLRSRSQNLQDYREQDPKATRITVGAVIGIRPPRGRRI